MATVNLVDALSGRAKLEGIQWMLRSGAPRRALRRELNALLLAPDMLGPCQLRYARFGPGRKLTAYYDALIHQLVRVSDPRYVRDVVAGAYAASEVAPDQAPASWDAVTSIRYRPGKRHVLRYEALDAAERGTIFAKLYHSEKGARVFRVATQVAEWLAEYGNGVTSVRPLAYLAEDAVVLYPRVFGRPLSERLRRPGHGVAQCLERAGAALHALHRLPQAAVDPLRTLDFAAEIREV